MNDRQKLLSVATVRTEDLKLDCLQNTQLKDIVFTVKEMNIAENKKYRDILKKIKDNDMTEAMKYACSKVMVEPAFFTDEEFESMNGIGEAIMNEIFFKIPTIGLSEEQKEEYKKKVIEFAENEAKKEENKEETKKPSKRRGDSSSS